MVTFLLHPLCEILTGDQLSSISFRVAIARKQKDGPESDSINFGIGRSGPNTLVALVHIRGVILW